MAIAIVLPDDLTGVLRVEYGELGKLSVWDFLWGRWRSVGGMLEWEGEVDILPNNGGVHLSQRET